MTQNYWNINLGSKNQANKIETVFNPSPLEYLCYADTRYSSKLLRSLAGGGKEKKTKGSR